MSSVMLSSLENVSWEMKIQLSMGWLWVFLIQAPAEISDVSSTVMVSKVTYIESLKRLEKCFRPFNN